MNQRQCPPIIETPAGLEQLIERLRDCTYIGVDTEMDSYYHYHEKVCLLQISDDGADYLVDPLRLDLSPLNAVFNDSAKVIIFHAGMNDIPHLYADHKLEFAHIFDTYTAAEILHLPNKGLAGLIKEYFDIDVDKQYQKADWTIRPLSADMDLYARGDTRYLAPLRAILYEKLAEKKLLNIAERMFADSAKARLHPHVFDPDRWIKVKNFRSLKPESYGVLRRLYIWRENTAQKTDLSVFRVLPDHVLISLAEKRPRSAKEMLEAFKASSHIDRLRFWQNSITESIREGIKDGCIPIPSSKKKWEKLSKEDEAILKSLKEWRNKRVAEGRLNVTFLTNKKLHALLGEKPADLKAMAGLKFMIPEVVSEFGAELLSLLWPK